MLSIPTQAEVKVPALIKSIIAAMLVSILAGCAASQTAGNNAAISPAPDATPTGPEYVEGLGYLFSWNNGNNSVISVPADIKKQALAICEEKGATTAYMSSVAFEDGMTKGYFNCRGSGGN